MRRQIMKTIRLLYPDYLSGGLDEYYFGSCLMSHIIPENRDQKLVKVDVAPPDGRERSVTEGIYAKEEVIAGIRDAMNKIEAEKPDRIITIGGNCMVSLAPFDYLHGSMNTGIIWIDAHPDVSVPSDGYPNAHAMVLRSLMGKGEAAFSELMKNRPFSGDEILYIGLQPVHDYQKRFLDESGIDYKIQDRQFISDDEIRSFVRRFDQILVHLDIDVLDERKFHSTYFANPELSGDGSGGGRMTVEKLSSVLTLITGDGNVTGFTIAEYLPFDEYRLHRMFSSLDIFTR